MAQKVWIIGLLLLLFSCDRKEDTPQNEFTINSADFEGFSFESFKVVKYPGFQTPDFFVLVQIETHGELKGPYLSHPDLETRFFLAGEFEDIESAEAFYISYHSTQEQTLQQFAMNVKPNQVWLIKTNSGNYGKILIIKTKSGQIDDKPFAEIVFRAEIL